jgi:hypothetical protein
LNGTLGEHRAKLESRNLFAASQKYGVAIAI